VDILDQLINSGVDVLKIEGRSKGADYVHEVTACYREAINSVLANDYTDKKKKDWLERLSKVYNRGFWEGYYLGRKLGEWTSSPGSIAEERKIYLGRSTNYYSKIKVGEFLIEAGNIKEGDELMVIGPSIGMAKELIHSLIVNGEKAEVANKGDKITFPFSTRLTSQDKLYKILKS
jgi:putative protease